MALDLMKFLLSDRKSNVCYNQWEENKITFSDRVVIFFFNMEFDYVLESCKNGKSFLGWSSKDIRGVLVPLFLLAFNKNNELSKAGKALVDDMDSRLDFEEKDNQNFVEAFLKWKELILLTEEQFEKYVDWLRQMVKKRTDAVDAGRVMKTKKTCSARAKPQAFRAYVFIVGE